MAGNGWVGGEGRRGRREKDARNVEKKYQTFVLADDMKGIW